MNDLRVEFLARLAIVWRRRWQALAAAWILCLVGWSGTFLLPSQYRSQALVYVDTDTLLGPLLKDLTVENDMQHQVALFTKTLLSRPNLHKVAVATDLALDTQSPAEEINLYEHMERHAEINIQGPNLLTISYTDPNPLLARDVVQALLAVLVDNSNAQNRSEMEKALDFIEKQIAVYEEKLRGIERRIAEFKRAHGDSLLLGDVNLSTRKDNLRDAVNAAQGQVAELKAGNDLLAQQIKSVPQFITVDNSPSVIVQGGKAGPSTGSIADLKRTLEALQASYTDKHPDVIAAKRRLDEALDHGRDEGAGEATSGTGEAPLYHAQVSNPVYEQMQMRLFDSDQQLALKRNHLAVAMAAQSALEIRAAENPSMVAQYTDLTREYGVLKKQYDELLVRRESALMSQAVENTSQKIQFRVVDPPRVPVKPSGSHRLLFLAGVFIGGIAAATGLVFLLDRIQAPVTSPDVLARIAEWPVLGMISSIGSTDDEGRKRQWNIRFAGATLSLFLVFCGLFLFTLHSSGLLTGLSLSSLDWTHSHVG